jgi:4-amino-4-deoxy-L-arabinose transferase-like glycosyltransferase
MIETDLDEDMFDGMVTADTAMLHKDMLTRSFRQFWFAALAIILLTVATRLPLIQHPQAFDDEAAYSVVANAIVDGGRPYVDAIERKPPLLFWTYAAIFKLAGKYNWIALHVVALIWTLATMAGLYVIGRTLFDRTTGLIAALFYSIFQPWLEPRDLAFNGELVMNLPIVWAWAIALRPNSSRLRPELLLSGALLCAGFLLKQPAAIAAVPLGIYLLLPSYRASRGLTQMASIIHAAMLTAGLVGALGAMALVLYEQGILREAIYWTIFAHAVQYVFWDKGVLHTLAFVAACLPVVLGAVMSLRDSRLWTGKSAERTALFGLLVASAIGTAAGARFYFHYYIQLIPPFALLAAPYYAGLWSDKTPATHWLLRPKITYRWLALTIVTFSLAHWVALSFFRKPTETGQYLLQHSNPNDRIFIWGIMAKLYLEAQRSPASRYIMTFPLTGHAFGGVIPGDNPRSRIVLGAWTNLEQDFARHPPAYIVDVQEGGNARYPVRDYPILARLLEEKYEPVARTRQGVIYRRR